MESEKNGGFFATVSCSHNTTFGLPCEAPGHALHSARYQKLPDAWGTRKRLIPLPHVRVCVVLGRATIDEVALSLLHVPSRRE
jgi:hypothetical protein